MAILERNRKQPNQADSSGVGRLNYVGPQEAKDLVSLYKPVTMIQ